ncbi:MAG: Xaa-Pro peptidase family protein [Candidatus Bathyarchaeota archaeon]
MNLEESLERRISSILKEVERRGFETVVFMNEVIGQNPSNFVYVSGPWGLGDEHNTLVFDVNGDSKVVLPHWGAKRMEERGRYSEVIPIKQEKGHHLRATKQALEGYDPRKVCFDLSTLSAQLSLRLSEELEVRLDEGVDISDYVFKMRAIKDDYEIAQIKEAIRITEEAVMEMVETSKPGVHIKDLKRLLDAAMIEKGAIEFSFWSSVGFGIGPRRSDRIVKHGDILLTDVGCRVPSGYCSDMGRTWPMTLTPEIGDWLERITSAHAESFKNIRAGVTGNEVLRRASEINQEYGLEPLVRCGHQIGLDVHDYTMPYAPSFGPIETDNQPLEPGMTLTFEPQHEDPNLGFRSHIEDIILVTEGAPVCLNILPWDLTW